MEVSTKEISKRVRKMAKALKNGLMVRNIVETGARMHLRDMASTSGQMDVSTRDYGSKISRTGKVNTVIQTADHIQVNTVMVTNMVLALMSGQMAKSTKATGRTISSTDREDGPIPVARAGLESGSMVAERNGYLAV